MFRPNNVESFDKRKTEGIGTYVSFENFMIDKKWMHSHNYMYNRRHLWNLGSVLSLVWASRQPAFSFSVPEIRANKLPSTLVNLYGM